MPLPSVLPDNRLREPLPATLDRVAPDWLDLVRGWRHSAAGQALIERVEARRCAGVTVYPDQPLRALALTPRARVRVVILGQDPYHGPGQAQGLAFSVADGVRAPPSLRNVLGEVAREFGPLTAGAVSLAAWARQGVLLLNTVLTVEDGAPASHADFGWEALTDGIVKSISSLEQPTVFLLWGALAGAKLALFDAAAQARHCVLRANHPSPLSARRGPSPFVGCGHFSAAAAFLARTQPAQAPLDWRL